MNVKDKLLRMKNRQTISLKLFDRENTHKSMTTKGRKIENKRKLFPLTRLKDVRHKEKMNGAENSKKSGIVK